jgi:hypothetical protein
MLDNTNVPLPDPSDADQNRALYSDYYQECCAKGGVTLQLCGWTRSLNLCTGGIDDLGYIKMVNILQEQKEFAGSDDTSSVPFLNILDKGYRCTLAANKEGQDCLQPIFAKSDTQFIHDQTLHSVSVAVVRASNERAVKQMKNSWLISHHGCSQQLYDPAMLDDIWLAWGFQVNSVYNTVFSAPSVDDEP